MNDSKKERKNRDEGVPPCEVRNSIDAKGVRWSPPAPGKGREQGEGAYALTEYPHDDERLVGSKKKLHVDDGLAPADVDVGTTRSHRGVVLRRN